MKIEVLHASEHRKAHYRNALEGHRAVRLLDDEGEVRGELVWRLGTEDYPEITEFGLFRREDRRQGWGTGLMEAGWADMRGFLAERGIMPRKVYLFCEAGNQPARGFYKRLGFSLEAILEGFYRGGDAALLSRPFGGDR
ncbi:MAG: GNAT family N-acetyltransferase [Planctomycetota bacterium]|jgi:ribosomal protein S18 acetylase RimI-like enzyme